MFAVACPAREAWARNLAWAIEMQAQVRAARQVYDECTILLDRFVSDCVGEIANHADTRHEALRDALLLARTNEGYGDHLAAVEAREIALEEALGLLGVRA